MENNIPYEIMQKRFDTFFSSLTPNDCVAIFSHGNCTDGMCATILVKDVLKNKKIDAQIVFLEYKKEAFNKIKEVTERNKINKIIILDTALDLLDVGKFRELERNHDLIFIDHHPRHANLEDSKKIIKAKSYDCTSWLIYELGKDMFESDKWIWLVCAAMVAEFSYTDQQRFAFIKKYYPATTIQRILDSEPGVMAQKIGSIVTYHKDKPLDALSLIEQKAFDKIEDIHAKIEMEIKRYTEEFFNEIEQNPSEIVYFKKYSPRFDVSSAIATTVSVKYPEKIIVGICEDIDGKHLKASLRHQKGKYDLSAITPESVKGLEDGTGGGHMGATGARFAKKELEKFKDNLLRAIHKNR